MPCFAAKRGLCSGRKDASAPETRVINLLFAFPSEARGLLVIPLSQSLTSLLVTAVANKESHETGKQLQLNGPTSHEETDTQLPDDRALENPEPQAAAVVLSEFDREYQKAKNDPSDFSQWVAVEKLLDKEVR